MQLEPMNQPGCPRGSDVMLLSSNEKNYVGKTGCKNSQQGCKKRNNKTRNPGGERNHKTQCSEVTPFSQCVNCCYGSREKWADHRFSLSPPFLLESPPAPPESHCPGNRLRRRCVRAHLQPRSTAVIDVFVAKWRL